MKKTVCVDLDGVLAQYDGWKGLDHIGNPIPGAVEFTKRLGEKYDVVIHTTRCSVEAQKSFWAGGISEEGFRACLVVKVKTWLNKHGFYYDSVYSGRGKPLAVAYIDDRAIECIPQGLCDSLIAFDQTLRVVQRLAEEAK